MSQVMRCLLIVTQGTSICDDELAIHAILSFLMGSHVNSLIHCNLCAWCLSVCVMLFKLTLVSTSQDGFLIRFCKSQWLRYTRPGSAEPWPSGFPSFGIPIVQAQYPNPKIASQGSQTKDAKQMLLSQSWFPAEKCVSHGFHFDSTSISLRFHIDFTSISLRSHFEFISVSLRSRFISEASIWRGVGQTNEQNKNS